MDVMRSTHHPSHDESSRRTVWSFSECADSGSALRPIAFIESIKIEEMMPEGRLVASLPADVAVVGSEDPLIAMGWAKSTVLHRFEVAGGCYRVELDAEERSRLWVTWSARCSRHIDVADELTSFVMGELVGGVREMEPEKREPLSHVVDAIATRLSAGDSPESLLAVLRSVEWPDPAAFRGEHGLLRKLSRAESNEYAVALMASALLDDTCLRAVGTALHRLNLRSVASGSDRARAALRELVCARLIG